MSLVLDNILLEIPLRFPSRDETDPVKEKEKQSHKRRVHLKCFRRNNEKSRPSRREAQRKADFGLS